MVIHANHHPRIGEAPPSTTVNPCTNPKCSDIPFPHESDHVMTMHELSSLETEDPRLTKMYNKMRPMNMPKYGLGYLERMNHLIPESRFRTVPDDCKKLPIPEMHKFFTLMDGCKKYKIDSQWIKEMLNWDIYTHPKAENLGLTYTVEEKLKMSQEWKIFMQKTKTWISFYVWKDMNQSENVLMTDAASSSTVQHSWSALDGSKIETSSTFPPYKGIILGEAQNSAKAITLILKDDNALGIDGRIQKASKQLIGQIQPSKDWK